MNYESVTEDLSVKKLDLNRLYTYFKGYTHVDMEKIPDIYKDYVIPMFEALKEEGIFRIKYKKEPVIKKEPDKIEFRDAITFTGKMIGRAYQDTEDIILFVVSIINIDELLAKHSDMMETFFLEYWAISALNCFREAFYERWKEELADNSKKLTYVWSPGQAKFELMNQKSLFALLKPENIGVTLDRHMRMIPLKTISGTVGIVPEDTEITMVSCDFCEHALTCPGYSGVKYKESQVERRLL